MQLREDKMTFHCLFEQSGTFKNVFKSYGHNAYDYDIQNEYGETDFQIDLFKEIEATFDIITNHSWLLKDEQEQHKNTGNTLSCAYAYNIFFKMKPETDFIIAFFPCTYFSEMNELLFRGFQRRGKGEINQHKDLKSIQKIIERNKERSYFFEIWIKMCFVLEHLEIKTIIENPSGSFGRNYLTLYSPWGVSYTDKDRSKFGDRFKKPTYFFAINFDMKENFCGMYFDKNYEIKSVHKCARGKERSEITPRYADNFYKRFLAQHYSDVVKETTI